jgi:hypothetical protein
MKVDFATEQVGRQQVIGLLIFTVMMLAGCIFLIYFLFALWRDTHKQSVGSRVEIIELPRRERSKIKVLHIYSAESLHARTRTGSERP